MKASWEKEKILVLKEEITTRRGRGGRSERQREKWCVEKQRKERKWKKKEKKERYKKRKRWKKCRELFQGFGEKKSDKHKEKKVSEGKRRQPKVRWTIGKFGKWLLLLVTVAQSWVGANAASEEAQSNNESITRMWQEMEVKERRS